VWEIADHFRASSSLLDETGQVTDIEVRLVGLSRWQRSLTPSKGAGYHHGDGANDRGRTAGGRRRHRRCRAGVPPRGSGNRCWRPRPQPPD